MITTMINEDYVSFEIAKLLKEKGFNEPCNAFYEYKKKLYHDMDKYFPNGMKNSDHDKENNKGISAPTHQRAMKWLRTVHNISIEPFVDFGSGDEHWWTADISYIKKDGLIDELCGYNSYEEAAEAALKYTLENFI